MIETNLAPGLLLAMPHLLDPNFARAVVLMIEHNEEGSFGLIVNRPSSLEAGALFSSLELDWQGDAEEVVWSGGPVMPSLIWVLHEPLIESLPMAPFAADGQPDVSSLEHGSTIKIAEDLSLSTGSSIDTLRTIVAAPPSRLRFILGYAGWAPGQLAQEMSQGSWLHADLDLQLLFATPPEDMWEQALRSLGIDPENIVQGIGIH